MDFVLFVLECILNMLSSACGASYSGEAGKKTTHGIVGGFIFLLCAVVLIKFFCLDYEGYPKKDWMPPLAIIISVIVSLLYFAVIYLLFFRT